MAWDDLSPLTGKPIGGYRPPTPLDVPPPPRFQRTANPAATPGRDVPVPVMRYANRSQTNCSMTFNYGGLRTYNVWARGVSHGFDIVAAESHARQDRAFYPRRAAVAQFAVTIELIHEEHMRDFMGFLRFFQNAWLNRTDETMSWMTVNCPARNFLRYGVPVGGGIEDFHVGSMVYSPTIIFEATRDPLETDLKIEDSSSFQASNDPEQRYFFPSGDQLESREGPARSPYDVVWAALDAMAVQQILGPFPFRG